MAGTVALVAVMLPAISRADAITPHAVTPHVVTPSPVNPPLAAPSPSPASPSPAASTPAAAPSPPADEPSPNAPPATDPANTTGSPGLIDGCGHRQRVCEEERIHREEVREAREYQEWIEQMHQAQIEVLEAERRAERLEREQANLPPWNPISRLLCPFYIALGAMANDQLERAIDDRGAVFDDESELQEAIEMETKLSRLSCITKVIP